MSNIYNIAELTGYSPSTVARALTGKGYVGRKTKAKILKTAESLDYRPNHAARSLRSQKTFQVLICIPDLYNPFYFNLIKGASDVLDKQGYHIILCHSKRNLKEELKIINMLKERYGDGIVFLSFDFNETNVQALMDTNMPTVAICPSSFKCNFDCVHMNITKAMHLATSYLIEMGHRDIGVIIGDVNKLTSKERFDGYSRAMKEHGLTVSENRIVVSDFTREFTKEAMHNHITAHGGTNMTAIVAANTLMGIGCMDACAENHIPIPQALSIISLDDIDMATCTNPRLSVIDMRQEEIGRKAAILLLEQIEGRAGQQKTVTIEPKLVFRESVRRDT